MPKPARKADRNVFVRHLRRTQIRQLTIAGLSLVAAALVIVLLPPAKIGAFAFYSVVILLILNAVESLLQYQRVLTPIDTLLDRLQAIGDRLDTDGPAGIGHLACDTGDTFSCLAASIDNVLDKLAERAREAESRALSHDEIRSAVPIALVAVARDGRVLRLVNDPLDTTMAISLELGKEPPVAVWGSQNLVVYRRALKDVFEADSFSWLDLDLTPPGGGLRHYRVSLKKMNDFAALMTLTDMTEVEQRFAATAESAAVYRTSRRRAVLRHMAASVAHDAKNVFTVLDNLVELNKSSSDASVRERTSIAEGAIRRGTSLMRELMSFAGETRYHFDCVPAAEGLRGVLENSTIRALVPRNVRFDLSFSGRTMPEIDLDADQMWKVVCNLVKNAVEAMNGNDGRIWIGVEPFRLSGELANGFRHTGTLRTGAGVLITLTDDGPGIPENLLEHLFDPYISNKGEGRGLGLATVQTIVDAHCGAISVKSSPGFGTAFSIFLPASHNTADEIRLMREAAPNGEVLLVDDDPTILHTTGLILRSLKIAAHPAGTEEDALAKLRVLRTRLKAILVDASLRGICTAGFVQSARAEAPGLPVIVISGSTEETVASQFADVSYDRFLAKPYSVAELSKAIDEVTSKSTQ